MKLEEHMAESIEKFGEPFVEVHLWLDELAGKPGIGMRHRKYRHNMEGLIQVRRLFGERAVPAARQHIVSDLAMEGWQEGRDPFPMNEAHYVSLGLF